MLQELKFQVSTAVLTILTLAAAVSAGINFQQQLRFRLPDEFNYIKIYERVAGRGKGPWGEKARDTLARIFEDRRQYVKAEAAWKQDIAEYGPGQPPNPHWRQDQLDQIVKNWGRFDNVPEQAFFLCGGLEDPERNRKKLEDNG